MYLIIYSAPMVNLRAHDPCLYNYNNANDICTPGMYIDRIYVRTYSVAK